MESPGAILERAICFPLSLDLPDKRQIHSVGTVVIVNVQNGRSTLVTVGRNYNYGYRPSFFYPCDLANRYAGRSPQMTRSDMLKSGYCIRTAVFFLLLNFSLARANEGDLKPGDTVGPHNWQRFKEWWVKIFSIASSRATPSKLRNPRTSNHQRNI